MIQLVQQQQASKQASKQQQPFLEGGFHLGVEFHIIIIQLHAQ